MVICLQCDMFRVCIPRKFLNALSVMVDWMQPDMIRVRIPRRFSNAVSVMVDWIQNDMLRVCIPRKFLNALSVMVVCLQCDMFRVCIPRKFSNALSVIDCWTFHEMSSDSISRKVDSVASDSSAQFDTFSAKIWMLPPTKLISASSLILVDLKSRTATPRRMRKAALVRAGKSGRTFADSFAARAWGKQWCHASTLGPAIGVSESCHAVSVTTSRKKDDVRRSVLASRVVTKEKMTGAAA